MQKQFKSRLFTAACAFAALSLLAACSQDDTLQTTVNDNDGFVPVTLSATIDHGVQTRAISTTDDDATRCLLQIIEDDGTTTTKREVQTMTLGADGTYSATAMLNPNNTYTFLFWADGGAECYTATDLETVTIADGAGGAGIAWHGSASWSSSDESTTIEAELKHAVTKVTLQSTTTVSESMKATISGVKEYSTFNVADGKVTGETTTYTHSGNGKGEAGDVFSFYALVDGDTQDLTLQTGDQPEVPIPNVPLAQNKHVILKGDVAGAGLTEYTFTATIDEDWADSDDIEFTPKPLDLTEGSIDITDDGEYWITSYGAQTANTITINGNATVKLEDVNISAQDCGINITGGNPVIVVSGTDNTVKSATKSGIGLSNGAGVTIKGETGKASDKLVAAGGTSGGAGIGTDGNCGDITIDNVEIAATATSNTSSYICAAAIGTVGGGICGDITITNATINATGGANSPAIGLGTDNDNFTKQMGRIVISSSDITATGGQNASVIGLPYSSITKNCTYKIGAILITTDETLDDFLSKLTFGAKNGSGFASRYKVGKGYYNWRNYVPDFYNETGDGPWEGVTITAGDGTYTHGDGLGQE